MIFDLRVSFRRDVVDLRFPMFGIMVNNIFVAYHGILWRSPLDSSFTVFS